MIQSRLKSTLIKCRKTAFLLLLLFTVSLAGAQSPEKLRQFENAIIQGDQALKAKDYPLAKSNFETALAIDPESGFVQNKLAEIRKVYMDPADQARFNDARNAGDRSMEKKEYMEAYQHYEKAVKIKPDLALLEKMKQARILLGETTENRARYDGFIAEADKLFKSGKLAEARPLYAQAGNLLPLEDHPKKQLAAIDATLAAANSKKAAFDKFVEEGDEAYMARDFIKAGTRYEQALAIDPGASYPRNMLARVKEGNSRWESIRNNYENIIRKADELLAAKNYDQSLAQYKNAASLLPDETYPPQKIAEIQQILGMQKEIDASYAAAVAEADKLLGQKEYSGSRIAYTKASGIKPDERYPKDKITEIDGILNDLALAEQQRLAEEAQIKAEQEAEAKRVAEEQALKEQERLAEEARIKAEQEAEAKRIAAEQALKEQERLAELKQQEEEKARLEQQRLAEEARMKAEQEAEAERIAAEQALKKQERLAELKRQEEEKARLEQERLAEEARIKAEQEAEAKRIAEEEALKEQERLAELKRQEEEKARREQERLAEEARIKAEQEAEAERIAAEHALKEQERLAELKRQEEEKARLEQERLAEKARIKAEQEAEAKRIAEEEALKEQERLAELKRQEEERLAEEARIKAEKEAEEKRIAEELARLELAFKTAVKEADDHLAKEQYLQAIAAYEAALEIKPADEHSLAKLAEAREKHEEIVARQTEAYNKAIAVADQHYKNKLLDRAIDGYVEARRAKPDETYPDEMIATIRKYMAEHTMANLVDNTQVLIETNNEKRFEFTPLEFSKRRNNYVLLKMRKTGEAQPKIYVNYGRDGQRNGGIVLRGIQTDDFGDYIVRVSDQDKWYREDNNWLSIYSEGGSIELIGLQITQGD